uniref:Uncharacterized protein n=1 Tax=viral metagenome TaxID=1070528 RepID=A0A6M3JP05_9ZZZZ
MKHTPTPWIIRHNNKEIHDRIMEQNERGEFIGERPNLIARVGTYDQEDNAAFIVTACNSHDDVVAALEELLELLEEHQGEANWYLVRHYMRAATALAKAKGATS